MYTRMLFPMLVRCGTLHNQGKQVVRLMCSCSVNHTPQLWCVMVGGSSLSRDACRFLTPPGRAWFVQHMLRAYNQLFGEGVMEAWVAQQGPEKLSAQLRRLRHDMA